MFNVYNKSIVILNKVQLQKYDMRIRIRLDLLRTRKISYLLITRQGCVVAQWLRHYATNRQVADSILVGVIGIFQLHAPSSRTMALGSTQPLTEMSTRCISWGVKVAGV